MAISSRGEMGVGGGSRGGSGGGGSRVTATSRGYSKTKSGRKGMKSDDIMINAVGKSSRKSGTSGIADAPKSVGVRPTGPKVPVKNVKPRANRTRSGNKAK